MRKGFELLGSRRCSCWCSVFHWLELVSRWVSVHNSPFMDYIRLLSSSQQPKRRAAIVEKANLRDLCSLTFQLRSSPYYSLPAAACDCDLTNHWPSVEARRGEKWDVDADFFSFFRFIIHLTVDSNSVSAVRDPMCTIFERRLLLFSHIALVEMMSSTFARIKSILYFRSMKGIS